LIVTINVDSRLHRTDGDQSKDEVPVAGKE
jgi:hypothetical protein